MNASVQPRLAWFSPLPPERSGISQYSAELLPGLAAEYQIDVFVGRNPELHTSPDPRVPVLNAHDFVWKQFRHPYDLIVYQMGNSPCHDYMWPYLTRHPGLVVLHDGQLHHARGRLLMRQHRHEDYCAELRFNHPAASPTIAELGIAGLLGELTYHWPMRRLVLETARSVLVHNQWLAEQIREEQPHLRVGVVDMGVPRPEPSADGRTRIRARHALADDAIVFLAFGGITPEKRIGPVLNSVAALADALPHMRLLLVGETVAHYDALAQAAALGIAHRVIVASFVPEAEVVDYLAAADVCLCLRWPTSRETSASWLRCLAAGLPTVITDLVHTVDIPAYDPRSWTLSYARPSADPDLSREPEPACVSIDLLDEQHSLRLAMHRLATDARLRTILGQQARELWKARFTLERMVDAYRERIAAAMRIPGPDPSRRERLPAHIRADGTEHASALLRRAGLSDARIADLWGTPA